MTPEDSNLVLEYVKESTYSNLKSYFELFKAVFSEFVNKLPLPTTCCWMLVNESDDKWNHVQYFIFLDFGLTYNVLDNVFTDDIDQVGATFHGSIFNHLTTRSLWISNDEKYVTLHPLGRKGLFAWGEVVVAIIQKKPRRLGRARELQT